jgi:biopolymer transport protein ExbD
MLFIRCIEKGFFKMALGKRRKGEDDSQIDLTPMLDVVFIMLIFFIVTASFVNETGLNVDRPPTSDQPPPDSANTNIVFRVSESNDIMLEGRRIDIRSVRANVERLHAEKPEAKVVISSHPKAKTEVFVMISDQAREAGVYDISLSTD